MLRLPKSKKGRALLALAVVVAFVPGWYVVIRVASPWNAVRERTNHQAPTTTVTEPRRHLRIGAYNIAHGRGTAQSNWQGGNAEQRRSRLLKIARFLNDANLDVVVLNEVDFDSSWSRRLNQAELIAKAAGFPYWVEQRNVDVAVPFLSWRFGNAILSRFPIDEAQPVDFPAYSAWESILAGKKRGVVCTLSLPGGGRVRVLAVHLSHRSETVRIASAERIVALREENRLPFIAAGDFNSTRLGFPHVRTDATGRSAVSLLVGTGRFTTQPDRAPSQTDYTFSTTEPRKVIDWIMVSRPAALLSREVYPLPFSDHRPVVGTVRLIQAMRVDAP